jgi:hypothetical protein
VVHVLFTLSSWKVLKNLNEDRFEHVLRNSKPEQSRDVDTRNSESWIQNLCLHSDKHSVLLRQEGMDVIDCGCGSRLAHLVIMI